MKSAFSLSILPYSVDENDGFQWEQCFQQKPFLGLKCVEFGCCKKHCFRQEPNLSAFGSVNWFLRETLFP